MSFHVLMCLAADGHETELKHADKREHSVRSVSAATKNNERAAL